MGTYVEDVCDYKRRGLFDLERWARPYGRVETLELVVADGAVANTRRTVEIWSNDFETEYS